MGKKEGMRKKILRVFLSLKEAFQALGCVNEPLSACFLFWVPTSVGSLTPQTCAQARATLSIFIKKTQDYVPYPHVNPED